ncbi:MAG: Ni/Fe-hydrogenase, b-type cytochrome subunit [Acidobacteria bacterium]|nr:Ni/Fe-hydrogenase, b-type cytochrome subunit [Acidobacteriota bacterium]
MVDISASPRIHTYDRVYVWQLPVRNYHWINAICMVLLIPTGYIIGNPQAVFSANEPYQQYWFGIVRFTHFASAFVFFFNLLFRVYWAFVGNRFSRWNNYVLLKKEQWRKLIEVVTVDILQLRLTRVMGRGHNPLAALSYFALFLLSIFQVVTGFALYAGMSTWWLPKLFTWVVPLMGGDMAVRQWHHLAMWGFIIFTIFHVYIVFYHDYVEGRGTTSAMISGWEFERKDDV